MSLSEQEGEQVGRRSVLSLLSTLGAAQLVSSFSKDAVAAEAADGNDGVCQSMLGCNQPKNLPPPKRVYRDIFEEERELARQREAEAEAARAEQRKKQMLALKNQTEVLISGRKTLEKDMQEAFKQLDGQADDFSAWDDVRRMARLYDTALRKDGMNLLIDKIKKAKLQVDKSKADDNANKFNKALQNLDKAAKKRNMEEVRGYLNEALSAFDGWTALLPDFS
ncbi:hypothetical protein GUITHDRAFT_120989 [Guillardia theta CCMP2712]|uniref:Uncharacterized protein n=2 Tax=Guillardia theta TaxID=55529 RepID=L1I9T3_GUITC|nr:hypothetical protein GUITHDRAFT_120989 [Guillardia theta CCMP2712]EKX32837.1 hypothetical protein GUITHDRAFT_120989 [Guillardia theta CCMP2712]|eukprot:XP_005819817.1 hypothetical protein GUITHDRAFT_120989 [Guillardia theta CCMP2712]